MRCLQHGREEQQINSNSCFRCKLDFQIRHWSLWSVSRKSFKLCFAACAGLSPNVFLLSANINSMTRWARGKSKQHAYHEGSSWEELKNAKNFKQPFKQVDKDKRREHRRIKRMRIREANKVCFHCRMSGHGMADCPVLKEDSEHVFNMCFKCGSTEHKSNLCTARLNPGQEFAYAKCFVCGELGHLSKACPDNPRGLYPDGGCCGLCGSVEHFKRECPERKVKSQVTVYRLNSMARGQSMDDEMALYEDDPKPRSETTTKPKIVKF